MRALHARLLIAFAITVAPSVIVGAPAHAGTQWSLTYSSIVGAPREDVGAAVDAGVVYVFPTTDTSSDGSKLDSIVITESTLHITPHSGDEFGASVLQFDTNDDGRKDLIIGAPGRNSGSGAVYVIPVTSDGMAYDYAHRKVVEQGFDGIAGSGEAGDHFGATLAPGYGYKVPWFAIGVPDEDAGSTVDAGDVVVMPANLGAGSITAYPGHGAPGVPQAGDHFGAAMAPSLYTLAVGLPGHNVGAAVGAGQVDLLGLAVSGSGLPGSAAGSAIVQGADDVPGRPASGNHFGAAVSGPTFNMLAIGAPDENVEGAAHAGTVTTVPQTAGGGPFKWFTPGVNGMPGRLQSYEHFGTALFAPGNGTLDAGAPGADVGSAQGAGEVFRFAINGGDLGFDAADVSMFDESALHQGIGRGDAFGSVIGWGLAFGIPHKQVGSVTDAGEVAFVNDYPAGQWTDVRRYVQGRYGVPGTAEHGDEMGGALSQGCC